MAYAPSLHQHNYEVQNIAQPHHYDVNVQYNAFVQAGGTPEMWERMFALQNQAAEAKAASVVQQVAAQAQTVATQAQAAAEVARVASQAEVDRSKMAAQATALVSEAQAREAQVRAQAEAVVHTA